METLNIIGGAINQSYFVAAFFGYGLAAFVFDVVTFVSNKLKLRDYRKKNEVTIKEFRMTLNQEQTEELKAFITQARR